MADVVKTIGTAGGRDYSTIALWEADLDEASIYAAGDVAIGECYADSDFSNNLTFDGGGTIGLTEAILSVASTERHDGTANTGVRILGGGRIQIGGGITRTVEWLEVDANGGSAGGPTGALIYFDQDNTSYIKNCICHDASDGDTTRLYSFRIGGGGKIMNCIGYDVTADTGATGSRPAYCFRGGSVFGRNFKFYNCTGYKPIGNNQDKAAVVFGMSDDWGSECINCIGMDPTGTGTGSQVCFSPSSPSNITMTHNLSSDATASGTGSIINESSGDIFVSTVDGSEDLHLKTGAAAIDAGTDLGTAITDVNIDIDGRDRDAEGDIWDIGADEFVPAFEIENLLFTIVSSAAITHIQDYIDLLGFSIPSSLTGQDLQNYIESNTVSITSDILISSLQSYIEENDLLITSTINLSDFQEYINNLNIDILSEILAIDIQNYIDNLEQTIVSDVSLEDILSLIENLDLNIVSDVAETDIQQYLENLTETISSEINSSEIQDYLDSQTITITSSVNSEDTQNYFDGLNFSITSTIDVDDSKSFSENLDFTIISDVLVVDDKTSLNEHLNFSIISDVSEDSVQSYVDNLNVDIQSSLDVEDLAHRIEFVNVLITALVEAVDAKIRPSNTHRIGINVRFNSDNTINVLVSPIIINTIKTSFKDTDYISTEI